MYKYYAFISYNHKDSRIAQWLHKKLEGFKLPSEIHSDIEGSNLYLRPIFRDKEELDAGVLGDELKRKLEMSKYLIVICSGNSAASQWVSNEVRTFIELGRADKIIPVLIDEGMKYPEALRDFTEKYPDKELLGVSIPEVGKEKAFVRIIAKMLEMPFDSIWKRHERQQRRRMVFAAGVSTAFLAMAVAIAIFVSGSLARRNARLIEEYASAARAAVNNGGVEQALDILESIPEKFRSESCFEIIRAACDSLKHKSYYAARYIGNVPCDIFDDGTAVVISSGSTVSVLSIPSFENILTVTCDGKAVKAVSSLPESNGFASLTESTLQIWETPSGNELRRMDVEFRETERMPQIAIDPSGKYVAACAGAETRYDFAGADVDSLFAEDPVHPRIKVWRIDSGKLLGSYNTRFEEELAMRFIEADGTTQLHVLHGDGTEGVLGTVHLDDGNLLVTDISGGCLDIDCCGNKSFSYRDGNIDPAFCVNGNKESLLTYAEPILASQYHPIWYTTSIYDLCSDSSYEFIPSHPVKNVIASKDASAVIAGGSIWLRTGMINNDERAYFPSMYGLYNVSPENNDIVFGFGPLYRYDSRTMELRDTIDVSYYNWRLCEDGKIIALDRDARIVNLIDIHSKHVISSFQFSAPEDDVFDLEVSDDGKYCSLQFFSGEVKVYDVSTGNQVFSNTDHLRTARGYFAETRSVSFMPGTHIAAVSGKSIVLYDMDTGVSLGDLTHSNETFQNTPEVILFSPDAKHLLSMKADELNVYNAQDGLLVRNIDISAFQSYSHDMCSIQFSKDCSSMILFEREFQNALFVNLKTGITRTYLSEQNEIPPTSAFYRDNIPMLMLEDKPGITNIIPF